MILRALSTDDYFLSRVADSFNKRPMLFEARKHFADHKDHPAVAETQRLLYEMQDIGGQLFQGVVYYKELPGSEQITSITNEYWKDHEDALNYYMRLLNDFYNKANVPGFFELHKQFYAGAIAEAGNYINDSITAVMEDYSGKENKAYHMYILPINPYGWGFSLTTEDSTGSTQYAVISPVEDIAYSPAGAYPEYGFGGNEATAHYRELVVHEFVHSFITDVLEQDSLKQQIASFDSLYTPLLDSAMSEQGYKGWWGFVNEHIVRVVHTRVGNKIDNREAAALRKVDKEYGFILLPEAEEIMKQYENNRDKYPVIDDFLPVLINSFKYVEAERINERLHVN